MCALRTFLEMWAPAIEAPSTVWTHSTWLQRAKGLVGRVLIYQVRIFRPSALAKVLDLHDLG